MKVIQKLNYGYSINITSPPPDYRIYRFYGWSLNIESNTSLYHCLNEFLLLVDILLEYPLSLTSFVFIPILISSLFLDNYDVGLVCIAGGVLVFAVNSLLYLNQSVPPYGVSFNSIAEFCSAFPLSEYPRHLYVLLHM